MAVQSDSPSCLLLETDWQYSSVVEFTETAQSHLDRENLQRRRKILLQLRPADLSFLLLRKPADHFARLHGNCTLARMDKTGKPDSLGDQHLGGSHSLCVIGSD